MLRWNKYLKIGPYGLTALFITLCGAALRIILIALGWPVTNSDEGTLGLMALHIAYRGEHPVFFYGQNYMGALDAYLAAGLFHIFGPSLFALRLASALLFALFLLVMYVLISLLYNKKWAVASIALLSFGSVDTFTRQLKSIGGYPETLLFAALISLLTAWLAISLSRDPATIDRTRRFIGYACLGLIMGLSIWSDFLILPFVLTAFVLLIIFCRNEIRTRTTAFLLLGLIIGLLPLIIFNIQYPSQNSFGALLDLHNSGGTSSTLPSSLWVRILGTLMISIPMMTGANPLYPLSAAAGAWQLQLSHLFLQGGWGLGYLLLWAITAFLILKNFRTSPHSARYVGHTVSGGDLNTALRYGIRSLLHRTFKASGSLNEKSNLTRQASQLMILASVGLTLLSYISSPAPAIVPVTSSRYLVSILVSIPVVLAPLWQNLQLSKLIAQPFSFTALSTLFRPIVLLFIGLIFLYGTIATFQQVPSIQALDQQQDILINDLLGIHTTHIYSDYWTCNRLIFASNERIICSVLDENLHPGQDRYLPYRTTVQNDANAAYVFTVGSPQANAFAQRIANSSQRYQRYVFENYVVYQLESP